MCDLEYSNQCFYPFNTHYAQNTWFLSALALHLKIFGKQNLMLFPREIRFATFVNMVDLFSAPSHLFVSILVTPESNYGNCFRSRGSACMKRVCQAVNFQTRRPDQ